MGAEYTHFLVVGDKDWLPQIDTLARVDEVLRKWSLVKDVHRVFDLSSMTETSERRVPHAAPGAGIALIYEDAAQGECVDGVAGPSYYDGIDSEDRYISSLIAIAGTDFRIQKSDEYCYFEVTSPLHGPDDQDSAVAEVPWPLTTAFYAYQPDGKFVQPPSVKIHLGENWPGLYDWKSYCGYWRGGVVINFGKDLPLFCEKTRSLPAKEFVADLAAAFRGSMVEIGEAY